MTVFITRDNWTYYMRHCKGKVKHETARSANQHADDMERKHPGEQFTYYRCAFCKKLHVGHEFVSMK